MKSHILLYIERGLAIWRGFPDITHVEVNNSSKPAMQEVHPSMKSHILFYK